MRTLGALALKLNESCPSWRLCAEATTLGEAPRGKGSWSAKVKSDWLLSQKEGIFVIQPASKGASNTHIVAVDAEQSFCAIPLSRWHGNSARRALQHPPESLRPMLGLGRFGGLQSRGQDHLCRSEAVAGGEGRVGERSSVKSSSLMKLSKNS